MTRDKIKKSIELIMAKRGEDVVYRRLRRSVTLRIVPVSVEMRSETFPNEGGFGEREARRFLVEKDKLFFNPKTPFTPKPNDTFDWNGRCYLVCTPQVNV